MAVLVRNLSHAICSPRHALRSCFRSEGSQFRCRSRIRGKKEYLVDAPVSIGDGFSFSGGKYAEGKNRADEWFAQGKMSVTNQVVRRLQQGRRQERQRDDQKMTKVEEKNLQTRKNAIGALSEVKAHPACRFKGKAKDPVFGLTLGDGSQLTDDVFRWFCVEAGDSSNPTVILIHGFPSQAYSFRKVLSVLSEDYHVITFDWLGFGFSDKPQPSYGFNYTLDEYASSLESLIDELQTENISLVVQGYFSPAVVKYASYHQDKIKNVILVNPPIAEKHAKLPPNLSIFSTFLLGEIFSQDPLRASDKTLTSCGPYMMDEEDAMVYRRPYLTSGSSGFALNAISKAMKKYLKNYVENMRTTLASSSWKIKTTVCWGLRDRWLSSDGIEDFCKPLKVNWVELPMAGHHAQEDSGEELGTIIASVLSK